MRTVVIAMKKGGVGKTTTAVTLAAIAAQRGINVGLVDLDSQGTATSSVGIELSDNAADVLLGEMPLDKAWVQTVHGFRVIPSGPGTEGAEKLLAVDSVEGLLGLRNAIAAAQDLPDLMLIDTRPDENHAVLNAYVAANEYWLVVEPEPSAIDVVPRVLETVERITNHLNPVLQLTGVIPAGYDARTNIHAGGVAALRSHFGPLVTQQVPLSVKVKEAYGARTPLPIYAPTSTAAIAYAAVADQLGITQ